ncbi:hypothetical protein [Elizabethkingia anophelis]
MDQITTFLPKYRELNDIISNAIKNNKVSYQEQKTITEFYNQYSDVKIFEQMILEALQKQEAQVYSVLSSGIRGTIVNNIDLYTSASDKLNKIDITQIYHNKNKWLHEVIDEQMKISNECYRELFQVNKSLDSIGYREHTEQEVAQLWQKHELLTKEYNKEKEKLSKLYDEPKAFRDEFLKYNENLFSKIHALSISFLSVINSYYSTRDTQEKEEKRENKSQEKEHTPVMKDGLYFNMKIVAMVHDECNNIQFENLSQTELYTILNLQPTSKIPVIKSRQKSKVCHLIGRLYELLKLDLQEKMKWRESILDIFEIDENYYLSKYKKPKSIDDASKPDQEFFACMDEIFK